MSPAEANKILELLLALPDGNPILALLRSMAGDAGAQDSVADLSAGYAMAWKAVDSCGSTVTGRVLFAVERSTDSYDVILRNRGERKLSYMKAADMRALFSSEDSNAEDTESIEFPRENEIQFQTEPLVDPITFASTRRCDSSSRSSNVGSQAADLPSIPRPPRVSRASRNLRNNLGGCRVPRNASPAIIARLSAKHYEPGDPALRALVMQLEQLILRLLSSKGPVGGAKRPGK